MPLQLSASLNLTGSINLSGSFTSTQILNITSSTSLNSISSSYAINYNYIVSSSFATSSISSSYATTSSFSNLASTASYALNAGGTTLTTGSTYPITSSWSNNSTTASYALNAGSGGTTLTTGSTYPITSSWSNNSLSSSNSISSSYALTASFALNAGTTLTTGSTYPITSSWSNNSISSSYVLTASYALNGSGSGTILTTGSTYPITSSWSNNSNNSISSSYALTASFALNGGSGGTTLTTGSTYPITSSWSNNSISSSYALTASFALNGGGGGTTLTTGSTYPITSSWSNNSVSSSYVLTASYALNSAGGGGGTTLTTGSTYPITSSWANNVLTASYALNSAGGGGTTLTTGSTYPITSSWANNSISASFAPTNTNITASWSNNSLTASYNLNSVSSSYALTASFALNGGSGGTTLTTGSTYPITSSWANNATSASYSLTASYAITPVSIITASLQTGSIVSQTVLYNVTTSQDNTITGLNLVDNKWSVSVVEEWNSGSIAGDDYYNSCSLLLHFSGSNNSTTFIDSSPVTKSLTSNNGAKITSSISKFGGSSLFLDGTDDYVTVANSTDFDFGSGDFTVEYWEYRTSSGTNSPILSRNTITYTPYLIGWNEVSSPTTIAMFMSSNGSSWDVASNVSMGTLTTNVWTHYAVTRQSNTFRTFQNGTLISSFTSSATFPAGSGTLQIGRFGTTYYFKGGYVDELRITKGVARYTGSFTTSSVEFQNNQGGPQNQTKYIGLIGGLNDSTVDYGVEKLSDSSLKIRKMSATGQPLSGSGILSASVDRVYVNVIDYTNVSVSASISNAVSSSYALTASYALNSSGGGTTLTTGSTYPITSSWSNNATTASYALNASSGGTTLTTGSTYPITSSWANNATSASYVLTASYALNSSGGGGTTLTTGSTYPITSSWANNVISSSYSLTSSNIVGGTTNYIPLWTNATSLGSSTIYQNSNNIGIGTTSPNNKLEVIGNISASSFTGSHLGTSSWADNVTSASYALTASFALNGGSGGGTTLTTGSTYPITSSWANNVTSASYVLTASYALNFPSTSSITGQTFTSDGTTVNYTLTQSVLNEDQILVVTDGVMQMRTGSYTVSGTTLTLTNAIESGSKIDVRYLIGNINTGGSGGTTLTTGSTYPITSSWSNNSITASFALNGGGTTLTTGSSYPITSSWSNNSITSSYALTSAPRTAIYRYGTTSVVNPGAYAYTIIKYDTSVTDSTGWYNNTTGSFKPTVAGWYQVSAGARVYSTATTEGYFILAKNGNTDIGTTGGFGTVNGFISMLVYFNGSTDYIQLYSRTQNATTNAQSSTSTPFTMVYMTS
jgi:hypothetical protein